MNSMKELLFVVHDLENENISLLFFLIPVWWIEKILIMKKREIVNERMDNLFSVCCQTVNNGGGGKEARGEEGTKSRDYQWKCWRETWDTSVLPCFIMWWHKQPSTVQLSVLTIRDVATHSRVLRVLKILITFNFYCNYFVYNYNSIFIQIFTYSFSF